MSYKNSYYYEKLSGIQKIEFNKEYFSQHGEPLNNYLNNISSSFFGFMLNAFVWGHTSQGYYYWLNIAQKYNVGKVKNSNEAIVAIYCNDNAVNKLKFTI